MSENGKVKIIKSDKTGGRLLLLGLCLFGFLLGVGLVMGSVSLAQSPDRTTVELRWYERVGVQAAAVWSVITQTSQQIFAGAPLQIAQVGGAPVVDIGERSLGSMGVMVSGTPLAAQSGILRSNTPLEVDNTLQVFGLSSLATTTINGELSVLSDLLVIGEASFSTISTAGIAVLNALSVLTNADIGTLSVSGSSTFGSATVLGLLGADSLSVDGSSTLAELLVSGDSELFNLTIAGNTVANGLITANGGIVTSGADIDLAGGSLFAANVVNQIIAGDNITITGTQNQPIISVDTDDLMGVLSLNNQTGDITLSGGTDIIISGLSIFNTSNLASVRGRGGCAGCITDSDVSPILTITGGSIDGTAIGSTTPATGRFTEITIGTTTSSTTLTVGGAATISDVLTVGGTATSTFGGSINLTSGCFAINGVCLEGVAPSTYVSLSDTPSSLWANSLQFANASGTALTQSADLVFTDGRLGIGTSTPNSVLTVIGDMYLSGALRDGLNASGTAGYLLQSTGTSTRWVSAAGFGDGTFLGLTDTPVTYATSGILYTNASSTALVQSNNFVFTGENLGVGTSNPLTRLSVANGDMSIGGANAMRFYNGDDSQYVGFRASSTLGASTVWTLPTADGTINQLLVTDGSGNLRFADVSAIGGGASTYLDLLDTPSSYATGSIPFANAGATGLSHSSSLVYRDGNLGVGLNNPLTRLSIEGGVRFQLASTSNQLGLTYGVSGNNRFGFGTDNPNDFVTIQGGSLTQRGGTVTEVYQPEITGSLLLADNVNAIDTVGNFAYVVSGAATNNFRVIDVTNPSGPSLVTSITLPTGGLSVRVIGRYVYVGGTFEGDGFYIIDIINPASPVLVETISVATDVRDIIVSGQYAYLAIGNVLWAYDITDPSSPFAVASTSVTDNINSLAVSGNYIYAVSAVAGNHFHVVDISNPLSVSVVANLNLGSAANDIVVQGRYAYIVTSSSDNTFRVINISTPTTPAVIATEGLGTTGNSLRVTGRYAYVGTQAGADTFFVLDIQNPSNPEVVGSRNLSAGNILGIAIRGRYAYVVSSSVGNRFQVIDISGAEIQSAIVHSIDGGSLSLQGEANIAGRLVAGLGVRAGLEGLQTSGRLSVLGAEASQIAGRLSVGTSSALYQLTVAGDFGLTGALYDSFGNAGALGMILRSTNTGVEWVATGTLGFSEQTLSLGTANQIPYMNGGGTDFVYSSNFTFNGSALIVTGNILPGTNLTYNLGSASNRFLNTWTETLNIGTSTWSIWNGNNGRLAISDAAEQGGNERFSILTNGNVGIGTTTPSERLTVAGTIQATNLLGGATDLVTDAQGNIIRGSSDERLKQNITEIENPLEIILGLRGVRYEWIDTERFGSQIEVGFLAQEVQTVLPEVVREGGEYWSLRTANIVAVVVEAIKLLWAELRGTQNEVTELRERVTELEAKLNQETQSAGTSFSTSPVPSTETEEEANDLETIEDDPDLAGDEEIIESAENEDKLTAEEAADQEETDAMTGNTTEDDSVVDETVIVTTDADIESD